MQESLMEMLWRTSHLSGGNAAYIEELYERYIEDPLSVEEHWREFFDKLPRVNGAIGNDVKHSEIIQYFELLGRNRARPMVAPGSGAANVAHERKQVEVVQLVNSFRLSGHLIADVDPLRFVLRLQRGIPKRNYWRS